MNHLHAYWVEKNNFGDLLTPLIVRYLSGRDPVRVEPNTPVEHFFVVGSTLHFATPLTTVWGTGIIYWRSNMLPHPHAKVAMTRGPLSCSSAAADALTARDRRPRLVVMHGIRRRSRQCHGKGAVDIAEMSCCRG